MNSNERKHYEQQITSKAKPVQLRLPEAQSENHASYTLDLPHRRTWRSLRIRGRERPQQQHQLLRYERKRLKITAVR